MNRGYRGGPHMGTVYHFTETELRFIEKQPAPLAVYQFVDRHVYTLALSDGFLRLFGYTDKADAYRLSNQDALINTHPDDVGRVRDAVHRFAVEGGRYEVIFQAKMHQSQREDCRIVHGIGEHVYTDTGVRLAYVWFTDEGEFTDDDTQAATLNRVFNHALHEDSFLKANCYDNLTGLPNMTHFFSLAEEGKAALKAKGGKAVILYMDLDGMKSYNDNYGFAEGDRLLKAFAQVLDKTFGNENCCHISADRFAVYTEDARLEDVLYRVFVEAERLNGGNSLPVRVGIYYPDSIEEVTVSTACDRAKMACDAITKSGASSFKVYSNRMRNEIKKRRYILSHLDRAISEKWIQVYYQPIVRSVSGKVCNEEALARWIDPSEGFLSPADFIPILENAGLIYKLDLFVLEQVLEKIRILENAELYIVPQSINLSRSDFDVCDMVEEIRKRVDASGISRDRLTIEITESIIGSDFEFIRTQVERFRNLGFPVWMDDFGSGYSSLDVLQSIRFDLIKFDMSFMRKLDEGDSGKIILTELMKMATSLGVDTICEGVETQKQVRFLQTIGCAKLQGFYYLKPVPFDEILERYRKGIQIGFENPGETGYYDTMGRINLYDLSFMANVDDNVLRNTFDTIPMGIVEVRETGDRIRFVRSNQSFIDFMRRKAGFGPDDNAEYTAPMTGTGFMRMIEECRMGTDRVFIDEQIEDGSVVHSFARRIIANPVTGSIAFAVAILSVDRPQKDKFIMENGGLIQENDQSGKKSGVTQKITQLQESVSSLLNNMPGMYFTKEAGTGIYLACNQAFADYAHKETPEGVAGLTDYEIFDQETAVHFVEDDKKALAMDAPYVFFEDVPDAAGCQKQFQTTKMKFIDSTGRQCLLGMCQDVTEAFRIRQEKDVYDQVTASLAEQYDTLYYIDIETSTYLEISSTDEYKKLNVPATGNDFFAESRRSIRKYVHPEDQYKVMRLHYKDVMLDNLKNAHSFSMNWRLVVNGQVRHIRHTEILSRDGKHIIVCIRNIEAEVQAERALREDQKRSVTYTQIAERMADHYDMIYYVDCESAHYTELSAKKKSGVFKIQDEGEHFFETARKNADRLIFAEDRKRIKLFLIRDNLISQLENRRRLTEDYRMVVDGGKTQYTRMSVTYSSDKTHFIICVENRDEDVQKEKEHLAELSMANEMARRDELTHTKNKTAYHEMEKVLQGQIEEGSASFGIVVCDINGLKRINDTEGHKAGDNYIKTSCMLICKIFHHSPVFRIGGDEFAVILQGKDHANRERLLSSLRRQVEENTRIGEGPVIASGLAEYQPISDRCVEDVFNRADNRMYKDKVRLKEQKLIQESHFLKERENIRTISEDRRVMLDTLYKAFEVVSEGTYVYLCDMKYDYSRWSKNAVDVYGLPSEYMYGAGDIWENCIHPEDREVYHKGIEEIFSGNAAGHDMQYRAKRLTGEYDVCTCRGVVIRDPSGVPDYFAGTIRNHGIQGHIDELTGLRNQYGFFEDLDAYIKRDSRISVVLFGISRFSEINEMYGYHFGNRVLQIYGREVFERTGNTGHTYRIDGTKFAVISNTLSIEEMNKEYESFRAFLHESFQVDGRKVLLDLHCGALRVDSFDTDSQTVYACLNYADEESKLHQQGGLVEFHNDLNEENHQRLEKIHSIRASIMHGCEGFYLFYQPVVDAETERLIGAEALLRWENDRYGLVSPDQFIPILESDPLFPELGEWIIRESILAAKHVISRFPGFIMNVNLSYTQLEKPDFVDMVIRILNELGFPPEHLCLEVTERCRLLDMELLKNKVIDLKSRGILVALDDFGTRFSSIGILKEIPINIIKIDRSIVQMIEENDIDRKIVKNIADLASIFNAKVCVEGIETEGMRDILKLYQVESFQGYYYAKPLMLEQFLEWVNSSISWKIK